MKRVTLLFPSTSYIWEFIQVVRPFYLEVRINQRIVICSCTDEHIHLATKKYEAEILNETTNY